MPDSAAGKVALLILAVWLAATAVWSNDPAFLQYSPKQIAAIVWILTAAALLIALVPFRQLTDRLSLNILLIPHLMRLVGIWFVVLYRAGALPFSVGVIGGGGDVIAALGAAWLMLRKGQRGNFTVLWNVFGLVDIVSVVVGFLRAGLRDPASVAVIRQFPLSLLPTLVVPLIIASHVIIFMRVRKELQR